VRVRLGVSLVVTALLVPLIPLPPEVDPFSMAGVRITIDQVVIGLAMGFVLRLLFGALELGGQIIATQMGLGFASLVDPQNGVQAPVISVFYNLVGTLLFLALNGHLILLQLLSGSFKTLPVGTHGLSADGLWSLATWAGQMFAGGVLIALPTVAALMIVNLAFGVMTRAAPQLNLFAVGFPISLLLGLIIMLLSLPSLVPQLSRFLDAAFAVIQRLTFQGA